MEVALAYDRRTSLAMTLRAAALDFAANLFRRPVSFRGRVLDPLLLRQVLLAFQRSVLSAPRYGDDQRSRALDPLVTVHHDQLFFEGFSADQSCYARLSAPLAAFELIDEVRYGTTNIDFSARLTGALGGLRSSRRTELRIGAGGVGLATDADSGAAAGASAAVERRVDVPDNWVKGFLQVQGALAVPAFAFDAHPADLLSLIAFLQENTPPSPPHGLRYEFRREAPISAVLEPWDRRFTLRGTRYAGYERTVRVWGRRRLELLRDVLPYAERVRVSVLGRGLPHVYTCSCGPYQFLLALSGWAKSDWSTDAAFDLLAPRAAPDPQRAQRVYAYLGEHLAASVAQIAAETGTPPPQVEQSLFALCRAGRVMVDPAAGQYRLRELFAEPLDVDALFAPDPRQAGAQRLFDGGRVVLGAITPPAENEAHPDETRALAMVDDDAEGAAYEVTIAVDESGRVRFGRCECPFFQHNLIARGPCAHIMAARLALDAATALPEPMGAG